MSKNVEVPIDLVRESVQIGVEAAALCEKVAADQSVIDSKAPLVANTLVENGLVDLLDKEATVGLLRDPCATLDIVAKLAAQARPRSMGGGTSAKSAMDEYDPQNRPEPESSRVFADKLNAVNQ